MRKDKLYTKTYQQLMIDHVDVIIKRAIHSCKLQGMLVTVYRRKKTVLVILGPVQQT